MKSPISMATFWRIAAIVLPLVVAVGQELSLPSGIIALVMIWTTPEALNTDIVITTVYGIAMMAAVAVLIGHRTRASSYPLGNYGSSTRQLFIISTLVQVKLFVTVMAFGFLRANSDGPNTTLTAWVSISACLSILAAGAAVEGLQRLSTYRGRGFELFDIGSCLANLFLASAMYFGVGSSTAGTPSPVFAFFPFFIAVSSWFFLRAYRERVCAEVAAQHETQVTS